MKGSVHRLTWMLRRQAGVTLMEILVVSVILGILALVAIPAYRKVLERGYWQEAKTLLLAIYHGEQAYFFLNNNYVDNLIETSDLSDWRKIHMDNPKTVTSMPVTFSVDASTCSPAPCFVATADRGDGRTMTIDENRNLDLTSWAQP